MLFNITPDVTSCCLNNHPYPSMHMRILKLKQRSRGGRGNVRSLLLWESAALGVTPHSCPSYEDDRTNMHGIWIKLAGCCWLGICSTLFPVLKIAGSVLSLFRSCDETIMLVGSGRQLSDWRWEVKWLVNYPTANCQRRNVVPAGPAPDNVR